MRIKSVNVSFSLFRKKRDFFAVQFSIITVISEVVRGFVHVYAWMSGENTLS